MILRSLILIFLNLLFANFAFSNVNITSDNNYLYIKSDGIPSHQTGQFPGRGNPHAISIQNHQFRVSLNPQKNSKITAIGMNLFGVALNGIPFDPATAEFWKNNGSSGWGKEAIVGNIKKLGIDLSNGHVQPNGTYHYHAIPRQIVKNISDITLIGYAADGFPIYVNNNLRSSYRLKKGNRPINSPAGNSDGTYTRDYEFVLGYGDLDICNNYFGITKEYPNGTNYYVLTENFPFVPRCLIGDADPSFQKKNNIGTNKILQVEKEKITKQGQPSNIHQHKL